MLTKIILIIFIYNLTIISAWALPCPDTASAIELFICKANEAGQDLKLIGEVEILINATAPDIEKTLDDLKKRIKPFFSKAKNAVFFNNHAGEALNDFFVYWITMINDYHPRAYEDLPTYQRRFNEHYYHLQEKANYLRIAFD